MIPISFIVNSQENRYYPGYTLSDDVQETQVDGLMTLASTLDEIEEGESTTLSPVINGVKKIWSDKEDEFLKNAFLSMNTDDCLDAFNKSFVTVSRSTLRRRCRELGLSKKSKDQRIWTKEQDDFLRKVYPCKSTLKCQKLFEKKFGISGDRRAIESRAKELKLVKNELLKKSVQRTLTKVQIAFLKRTYPRHSLVECSELFEKEFGFRLPETTLKRKCDDLGIKKTKNLKKRWTQKEDNYLRKIIKKNTYEQAAEDFSDHFKTTMTKVILEARCKKLGLLKRNNN